MIDAPADAAVDAPPDAPGVCNVLTQTGCSGNERCTYISDASGLHVACEPMGTAAAGSACMVDPTSQLDNCVAGTVCAGACKTVCSSQGSDTCPMGSVCDTYSRGSGVIGACDRECDPLNDNDFDGPATVHTKTGVVCPQPMQGCYGIANPNGAGSNKPGTVFTCATDIHYTTALHHRTECTAATGCTDASMQIYLNSCNQGYLPLLQESTGVTIAICTALCAPLECYLGNCGTGNANQLGAVPHRCNPNDAVGTFNTTQAGEECTFWWEFELDNVGNFHRSPYSDTLGFCFDHSKYLYDSNNDGTPDTAFPPCSALPMAAQSPPATWGAADLFCVTSVHAGLPPRAPVRKALDIRLPFTIHP